MKIVFEREYGDDAPMIEERMVKGTPLQQAVCDQLAAELVESGPECLSPVVTALRDGGAEAYDDKGLPFSSYIGFVPTQHSAAA